MSANRGADPWCTEVTCWVLSEALSAISGGTALFLDGVTPKPGPGGGGSQAGRVEVSEGLREGAHAKTEREHLRLQLPNDGLPNVLTHSLTSAQGRGGPAVCFPVTRAGNSSSEWPSDLSKVPQ